MSEADWRYQIYVRKYGIYSPVLLRHFSELETLYNTIICMAFVQKKKIGEKENRSFEENAH